MVTFYQCGHGDCALIDDTFNIPGGSEHVRLYVDLGPRKFRIPHPNVDADVLITHSDDDHCRGQAAGLNPRRVFVPSFFAEMTVILLKLLQKTNHGVLNRFAGKLIPVDTSHPIVYSPSLQWEVFNPKRNQWGSWVSSQTISVNEIIEKVNRYLVDKHVRMDVDGFFALARDARRYYRDNNSGVDDEEMRLFVIAVLYKIYLRSRQSRINLRKAISAFKCYDANEYSIVFKYFDSKGTSFLFTGDAPSLVYQTANNIGAKVLKVPHHGSSTGFDIGNIMSAFPHSDVLTKINPEIMIVSHGDRKQNPPHVGVIAFLNSQPGRQLFLTSDITRNKNLPQGVSYKGVPYNGAGIFHIPRINAQICKR